MNSIIAEYSLPVIALVVSIIVLILTIKQNNETKKIMENDKEFMEWREKKERWYVMSEITRTNDEIYKSVSSFYKNKRLSKDKFIRRLKYTRSIIDGDKTISEVVGWIFTFEEIEFYPVANDDEIRQVKKAIREDIKGILELLDIKVTRNKLTDNKSANTWNI